MGRTIRSACPSGRARKFQVLIFPPKTSPSRIAAGHTRSVGVFRRYARNVRFTVIAAIGTVVGGLTDKHRFVPKLVVDDYGVTPGNSASALISAAMAGSRRSLSRQRRRLGPMLPTGIPSLALISTYGTGGSSVRRAINCRQNGVKPLSAPRSAAYRSAASTPDEPVPRLLVAVPGAAHQVGDYGVTALHRSQGNRRARSFCRCAFLSGHDLVPPQACHRGTFHCRRRRGY